MKLRLLAALLLFAAVVACGPKGDTPESAVPTPTAGPAASPAQSTAAAGAAVPDAAPPPQSTSSPPTRLSPMSLPATDVTFRVQAPASTPAGEKVYLTVKAVDREFFTVHIELEPEGESVYSGTAALPAGAAVRYVYDRWDGEGCCENRTLLREALFTGDPAGYRLLIVEPELGVIEDVVPQWNDHQSEFEEAAVRGRVTDADTGEPLMDVEVTVGGVHVASRYDGSFEIEGLPPGPHRVVAYTVRGQYGMDQQGFELPPSGLSGLELRMKPAEMQTVRFTAQLPPSTPNELDIFLSGNLWQIGGRPGGPNEPAEPSATSPARLVRTGNTATGEFELPVGAYVEYFYTLGSDVVAEGADNARRFRSFIVERGEAERTDRVEYWGNESWPVSTIRVKAPDNTPEGVPVYFVMGPSHPMTQVGPIEWMTAIGSFPPGSEARFRFSLGDDHNGADGTPGDLPFGERTVTIGEEPQEYVFEVTKWENLPDPSLRDEDGSLAVTFRLSAPPGTPEGASILLTGDRPAVGPGGTLMQQVPGNPWLYQGTISFDHEGPLTYRYTLQETGVQSAEFTVDTQYHGQEVNDYLMSWEALAQPAREGWVSGIYTPDFWSEAFLPASASAFEAALEANGEWVAVSSVWSFGQIQPLPTLESRPVRIWSVLTPLDDIRAQARVAHESGLKVFLSPQMNPEVHPGWGDQTVSARSREWWARWLVEAEAQWMWNAIVAEDIGAEMLMLPGYVFHVFPPASFFDDPEYAPEFDLAVQDLIAKVREVYSGKIFVSGSQREYDFPGLADYIGVTTYDLGLPELPASATFEELHEYYEGRFEENVDAIWQRWGKPVLFYTVHTPAKPQEGDPFGQLFQAAGLEAIFQEIAERPYVVGAFSWSFDMVGASHFASDGVRGRAAEAVLAKWYALLAGRL